MGRGPCARPVRVAFLTLLSCAAASPAQPPPAGVPAALAVRDGGCTCVLPTDRADSQYYLVVGCLARGPGPFRVRVRTEPVADPVSLPPAAPSEDAAWRGRTRALQARLAEARLRGPGLPGYPPAEPPARRSFYLFTGDGDPQDAAGYAAVPAELRAVGQYCQVYVDRAEPDPAALGPTVADVVHTFDEEVYPGAARALGRAADVDRDGRFTVLLTGRLGRLQNGRVAVAGFVRGSDFYADLPAPFGNRCDMLYLNAGLRPGPHLRTVLAHEFTHAVVCSEHLFGGYLPERPTRDEEGWLNEGLAHVTEERAGYGWSNLDYRVSAFLSAPEQYQLVVPDYYAAGLWRNPGNRGATYLFLRFCVARYGDDLPARLTRSSLCGVENLETATWRPFAELFREWSAAVLLAGANLRPSDAEAFGPRLQLRRPLAGWVLAGPHFTELPLAGGKQELRLAGTSAAYLLLHSPAGARTAVRLTADPDVPLQVSVVRLPEGTGRLQLRREAGDRPGTVRLRLTAHDAAVTLDGLACEPLMPQSGGAGDGSHEPAGWFGVGNLRPGETVVSRPLPVPAAGVVFKVTGTDAGGRRVAAWETLP